MGRLLFLCISVLTSSCQATRPSSIPANEHVPVFARSATVTLPVARFDRSGEEAVRCVAPAADVGELEGCATGAPYPDCKWRLPDPERAGHLYSIWRNTTDEHRWGRPALVTLALAVSADYARRYPGETLTIGDLDAPGDRHATHDRGVDMDVYLPGTMLIENEGTRQHRDNYAAQSSFALRMLRARVETLARIVATCTQGRVRIYYNDEVVRSRFLAWYRAQDMRSPFGQPMQRHNALHDFHFHITIPEALEPVPLEDERQRSQPVALRL